MSDNGPTDEDLEHERRRQRQRDEADAMLADPDVATPRDD